MAPPPNSASFVKLDMTTKGNWYRTYGADGYNVSQDANVLTPAYAVTSFIGSHNYIWAATTSNVQALQRPEALTSRIAAVWYGWNNYTIDMNLTDGKLH